MPLDDLVRTWERLRDALVARGAEVQALDIAPPAPEVDVVAVEKTLGSPMPAEFRGVITTFSAHAHFWWGGIADKALAMSGALRELGAFGELQWDLGNLVRLEQARRSWAELVIDLPREYAIWSEALAFQSVGNGDLLGIDRRTGAVVYLSHESGADSGHGAVLAASFTRFVIDHSKVACSGPDHFVLEHVLAPTGIDPSSPAATQWRAWLGLPPLTSAA